MQTYHIHINGIVQGVGFRPMVYKVAKKLQLKGYVQNEGDGVHIFFNSSEENADLFFKTIKLEAPSKSKIISAELNKSVDINFLDFAIIVNGDDKKEKKVLMSPDTAICTVCTGELQDINNRRHRYPFITCAQCGPRYSINNSLPYERHGTSMQDFTMCKTCNEEYNNVMDRRFFSQTNSCAECGVELTIWENASKVLANDPEIVLSCIKNFIEAGKIIAVKGIGGYLLLCDANSPEAIQLLRSRKHRNSKPFAILYPDIKSIQNNFEVNQQENTLLESEEAPIVLLYPKPQAFDNLAVKEIAPGLMRLGVMLPYSPLLHLIANDFGKPLIATSANISGSPIIYKDGEALEYLFEFADHVVSYNRKIVIPQDDSVIQVSKEMEQQIFLRRSRGYAPSFLSYNAKSKECVLSTGAFIKSSFTLLVKGNIFVSQFLGSGESYESQQMYKETLKHCMDLYEVKPSVILADLHPGYFAHQYAIELAGENGSSLNYIQHHEAHFAAVLAENNLLLSTDPVLGVIWDGTGLGRDGNIWGGEFFKYKNNEMVRSYHFDYFPAIAGDKLASEPRIAALCTANDFMPEVDMLKKKFTNDEWNNYQSLINTTRIFSSSAGRIFDAVASLLDLCDKQTYEGEAAIYLQSLAEDYINENGFEMDETYFNEGSHYYRIPVTTLIQGVMMDLKKSKSKSHIAAKFHYSLVCLIDIVASNIQVENICFSGGVFQNALLTDWIQKKWGGKYKLYFHKNLSPNDENISFGQLAYYDNNIRSKSNADLLKNKEKKLNSAKSFEILTS